MTQAFFVQPAPLTHRLANGLQIVGQVMPEFESVALSYAVRAGACDEHDPCLSGVSHFLEHMVFKGTATLDWQQLKQAFTRIGAQKNGSTSVGRTIYYLRVQAEYVDQAFRLLSEMMFPRLDARDFEQEKEVIINEIARSEDSPSNYARRQMMRTHFRTHPLGNDVLGSRESIRTMCIEQMRDYWEQRYGAGNMVLAVAGKFDWDHLVDVVEQTCGEWRAGIADRVVDYYEPPQATSTILVEECLKQQIMLLSMPMTTGAKDADAEVAELVASILGHPNGSRLYWRIRQKGLAQTARSTLWSLEGTGLLFLEAMTTPAQAPHVLRLLREEVEGLVRDGIDEQELRRAKDKRTTGIVLGAESTYGCMRKLSSDWMYEEHLYSMQEAIARVEQVTSEDVMRVLGRFPLREKQVLTTLGPLSERDLLS
jgi:predicted Zn-dependent peptidase